MNPHKCQNSQTARHLARYWESAYNIHCVVHDKDGWSEVVPTSWPIELVEGQVGATFWRNICEAFIAGRYSVVG